jgi:hypothetical protein
MAAAREVQAARVREPASACFISDVD